MSCIREWNPVSLRSAQGSLNADSRRKIENVVSGSPLESDGIEHFQIIGEVSTQSVNTVGRK
jgi:hypothetical protein